ncbi:hypothetical protein EYR36_008319 [Pleurotus pulmonarius]|nr:hypothetical protein EYR36_008319 [Pleurotus pulmonarius]
MPPYRTVVRQRYVLSLPRAPAGLVTVLALIPAGGEHPFETRAASPPPVSLSSETNKKTAVFPDSSVTHVGGAEGGDLTSRPASAKGDNLVASDPDPDPDPTTTTNELTYFKRRHHSKSPDVVTVWFASLKNTTYLFTLLEPELSFGFGSWAGDRLKKDTLSGIFEGNSVSRLPRMSFMLTHVAFAGHSRRGKSRVEVHYNGDAGETICSLAALIPDSIEQMYMRLPFIADTEYSVHVFGETDVCLAGYKLLDHHYPLEDAYAETQIPSSASDLLKTDSPSVADDEDYMEPQEPTETQEGIATAEGLDPGNDRHDWETFLTWRAHTQLASKDSAMEGILGQHTPPRSTRSAIQPEREQSVPNYSPSKAFLQPGSPSRMPKNPATSVPPIGNSMPATPKIKGEAAHLRKRPLSKAEPSESPKRAKQEEEKEGVDISTINDGNGPVIKLGDEIGVRYALFRQVDDKWLLDDRQMKDTVIKIGDPTALFGMSHHLEGMMCDGERRLIIPSGVLVRKGRLSKGVWKLKVKLARNLERAAS